MQASLKNIVLSFSLLVLISISRVNSYLLFCFWEKRRTSGPVYRQTLISDNDSTCTRLYSIGELVCFSHFMLERITDRLNSLLLLVFSYRIVNGDRLIL